MSNVINFYERRRENIIKTAIFVVAFVALFAVFGYFVGYAYGDAVFFLPLAFLFSSVSSIVSLYYSDKIILSMSSAREIKKEDFFDYYTVVENISIGTGLPMPRLYVIDDTSPNAFATGRSPKNAAVVVTTGLLSLLNRSELEGVIAHEMSHIGSRDTLLMTVVAILVGTIVMAMDWMWRVRVYGGRRDSDRSQSSGVFLAIAIIAAILTPIIAQVIKFAISRQREFLADATAVKYTRNPRGLISALRKISSSREVLEVANKATAHLYFENPLDNVKGGQVGRFKNLFSTHPPVEERIRRLEEM